uniref:Uncharacterized protein n=1 Tax=Anguilla anguilla TaxID=7936 RepID=A0A0E9QGN7_ANGAN
MKGGRSVRGGSVDLTTRERAAVQYNGWRCASGSLARESSLNSASSI